MNKFLLYVMANVIAIWQYFYQSDKFIAWRKEIWNPSSTLENSVTPKAKELNFTEK